MSQTTQHRVTFGGRQYEVERDGDCLIWTGRKVGRGRHWYGVIATYRKGRQPTVYAHRTALEDRLGTQLPEGLTASHLCGRSLCVNGAHLVAETQRENLARRKSGYIRPSTADCSDYDNTVGVLDSPPSTQAASGSPPDSNGLRVRQVAEMVAAAGTPG